MILLKNKRGNILMSIMVALIIFMVGMTIVNFIKPDVTNARSDLTCTAPATDGTKMMCLGIDMAVPYFIILICSLVGGIITEKLLI